MQVISTSAPVLEIGTDAIVVGVWKDEPLSGAAQAVDEAADGLLTRMIELEEISTSCCTVSVLLGVTGVSSPVVAVVGLGKCEEATKSLSFRAAGAASKTLASKKRNSVAFFLDLEDTVRGICGAMVGCQGQDILRKELKLNPFEMIHWCDASDDDVAAGIAYGSSINLTRNMVNLPANEVFPESFAEQCQSSGKSAGFSVEVWDEHKLAEEKCGAFLAVARGSARPPRLVIMRYNGAGDDSAPIAFVGKGVTFDSGGLSLKPTAGMLDMKCDMAGAATVLGAMNAIAMLELPINVVGLCGLAENMISSDCYRLGDVLVARNGKTIEVHNTDAEGRLVLADTLNVAEDEKPRAMIDLATLTGACVVALGNDHCGLMTNNQDFCDQVKSAAESCGELVWQLPMDKLFNEQIKSQIADIKNVGDGRWGGAITAAKFLEEFVTDTPWVHIDIAGPSFAAKASKWIDGGSSGCMVQTLVEIAKRG